MRTTLALGPVLFVYWLMDRGIVPWDYALILSIGGLIFGLWLATAALADVMDDDLRAHAHLFRERLGEERATENR